MFFNNSILWDLGNAEFCETASDHSIVQARYDDCRDTNYRANQKTCKNWTDYEF